MGKLAFNSGLRGFRLIDAVTDVHARGIEGFKRFVRSPPFLGIEALAQLGALHVRFVTGFDKHAFLLILKHFSKASGPPLEGPYRLRGRLIGRGGSAFSYHLEAVPEEGPRIEGEFVFATMEYDRVFRREMLAEHYREVFSCLRNGSGKGC